VQVWQLCGSPLDLQRGPFGNNQGL
jgi:hypothetical protein